MAEASTYLKACIQSQSQHTCPAYKPRFSSRQIEGGLKAYEIDDKRCGIHMTSPVPSASNT